jgi:hypothetical protein
MQSIRKVDQKYLENFEMWCWRRMEISWTDRVTNEVLHRFAVERDIVQAIKRRRANWIGQFFCRNCLLKRAIERKIEGAIEVMGRLGKRSKQLLYDIKEIRRYWKLKDEALDRTL